jgi:ADP-heptose:LPS heptosyltransferase
VESAHRDATFFRLCGIKRQIGVPVTEAMQENRWMEVEQALEPEAERLVRNITELGDGELDSSAAWDLHLTEAEHARAAEAMTAAGDRPVIVVSVGTKIQAKDWGRENWRELLGELARIYPEHMLILAGAPEEYEASEFAASGWSSASPAHADRLMNLCGSLSVRESAGVLARARIFIGQDSGLMHIAAAVETPCVAIFSARRRPRVWFPHGAQHRVIYHAVDCWGCRLETCIVERKRCLTSISVDEVLNEVRQVLV